MLFHDKTLSRKERKAAEAEKLRSELEATARVEARTGKKKVKKLIAELEQSEQSLIEAASIAKSKGYTDVYRQQLSALKVARVRKMQAEKFLFQIETMETMKSITESSAELLGTMGSIMGTLGKISGNKDAAAVTKQNLSKTQHNLHSQSLTIDRFFDQLTCDIPDDGDEDSETDTLETSLENEIQAFSKPVTIESDSPAVDPDVARFRQLTGK